MATRYARGTVSSSSKIYPVQGQRRQSAESASECSVLRAGKPRYRVHDRVYACICDPPRGPISYVRIWSSHTVPRALRRLRATRMRKAKSKLLVSIAPAVRSRAALLLCAAATVPSSTGAITKVRSCT